MEAEIRRLERSLKVAGKLSDFILICLESLPYDDVEAIIKAGNAHNKSYDDKVIARLKTHPEEFYLTQWNPETGKHGKEQVEFKLQYVARGRWYRMIPKRIPTAPGWIGTHLWLQSGEMVRYWRQDFYAISARTLERNASTL